MACCSNGQMVITYPFIDTFAPHHTCDRCTYKTAMTTCVRVTRDYGRHSSKPSFMKHATVMEIHHFTIAGVDLSIPREAYWMT